jgi:hypothetical protein
MTSKRTLVEIVKARQAVSDMKVRDIDVKRFQINNRGEILPPQ